MIIRKMLIGDWWKWLEEYSVPQSTERPSQHRSATRYVNRQLSLGNRTRGDVGLI